MEIEIPQEHQGKDYVGEGFKDMGEVFGRMAELHTAANAPLVVPEDMQKEAVFEKVKGEDGNIDKTKLFSQLVEQSKLVGKKTAPFDFTNATDNEIKAHLEATRPESIDAYDWGEKDSEGKTIGIDEEDKKFYGEMLREAGVVPYKGNKIIKGFLAKQKAIQEEMMSAEGYDAEIKESFSKEGDYKKIAGGIASIIKGNTNEADRTILEALPNKYMGAVYRMLHKYNQAHGIKEGEDRGSGTGTGGTGDVVGKRAEIRKKMDALRGKPNASSELAALNKELIETYTPQYDNRLKGGK